MLVDVVLWTSAIAVFSLGIVAVLNANHNRRQIYFLTATLCGAAWSIGIFLFLHGKSIEELSIAFKILYSTSDIMMWAFLVFACYIANYKQLRIVSAVSAVITLVTVLWIVKFSGWFVESFVVGTPNVAIINAVPYSLYILYFVIYSVAIIAVLTKGYFKVKSIIEKKRMKYMLAAYSITLLFGAFFNLILPWVGNYKLIWVGPLGLIIFALITYVATTKYRLFNVRLYVARYLTLATVSVLLAVGYLLALNILYASNGVENIKIVVNGLITVIFLVIAFLAFRTTIYLTGRRFGGGLLSDNLVYQVSLSVLKNPNIHKLLHAAVDTIMLQMRASRVSLSVTDDSNSFYSTDSHSKSLQRALPKIENYMNARQVDSILTEELEIDSDLYRELSGQDITVVARSVSPSSHDNTTIFAVIKRFPLRIYSDKEIDVLKTIVYITRIAMDNAIYYRQINEFNQELHQRIAEATDELRQANSKLKKLDKAKDDFISMASHQLRTPLTSIRGYLSMLIEDDFGKLTKDQKHIIGKAYTSSKRMAFLISDFLDVSRLQTGKFELEQSETALDDVLAAEISQLQTTAQSHNIKLDYQPPASLPLIKCDKNKIRQVMMNMIDNAIFYSKPGGSVEISLLAKNNQIIFAVRDHGIGVPQAEQHRLFNKFFRASNAKQARPDGTGIGLYMTRKVILAHNGSLIFDSQENVGSRFGFRLPIS
jgi:signal transduction histidine kinase